MRHHCHHHIVPRLPSPPSCPAIIVHKCRCQTTTTASPIHIFHPVFEAFIHRPTQVPARRYLKMVRKIMDHLTQICRPEWKRNRDFQSALKEVLSHTPILETIDDDTRTDGNIIIEVAGIRIPICMMKVEAGEWGCDPSTQAALPRRT
jgi:hypothetical protein